MIKFLKKLESKNFLLKKRQLKNLEIFLKVNEFFLTDIKKDF